MTSSHCQSSRLLTTKSVKRELINSLKADMGVYQYNALCRFQEQFVGK